MDEENIQQRELEPWPSLHKHSMLLLKKTPEPTEFEVYARNLSMFSDTHAQKKKSLLGRVSSLLSGALCSILVYLGFRDEHSEYDVLTAIQRDVLHQLRRHVKAFAEGKFYGEHPEMDEVIRLIRDFEVYTATGDSWWRMERGGQWLSEVSDIMPYMWD